MCPTPWKVWYASRAAARKECRRSRGRGYPRMHPYRCACGHWHNSSRPRAREAA